MHLQIGRLCLCRFLTVNGNTPPRIVGGCITLNIDPSCRVGWEDCGTRMQQCHLASLTTASDLQVGGRIITGGPGCISHQRYLFFIFHASHPLARFHRFPIMHCFPRLHLVPIEHLWCLIYAALVNSQKWPPWLLDSHCLTTDFSIYFYSPRKKQKSSLSA